MGECNRGGQSWPEFLNHDRLAKTLGIQLVEVGEGYGKTVMTVTQAHLNGLDHTQGGAVFSLADYAFAAATNSWGTPAVGISCTINYIQGSSLGDTLTAECFVDHQGGRIGQYTTEVRNQHGELIAKLASISHRFPKRPD